MTFILWLGIVKREALRPQIEQMNQYNDNKGTTVVPGLIDFFCWDDMDVMYRLLSIQTMRLCEVCLIVDVFFFMVYTI